MLNAYITVVAYQRHTVIRYRGFRIGLPYTGSTIQHGFSMWIP